jgi:hypothetical protein
MTVRFSTTAKKALPRNAYFLWEIKQEPKVHTNAILRGGGGGGGGVFTTYIANEEVQGTRIGRVGLVRISIFD